VDCRSVIRCKRDQKSCSWPGPQTVTAPTPAKLIPNRLYGINLWVDLLLKKFHGKRPIDRVLEQLPLLGLKLSPGTVASELQRMEPTLYLSMDVSACVTVCSAIGGRTWAGLICWPRRDFQLFCPEEVESLDNSCTSTRIRVSLVRVAPAFPPPWCGSGLAPLR